MESGRPGNGRGATMLESQFSLRPTAGNHETRDLSALTTFDLQDLLQMGVALVQRLRVLVLKPRDEGSHQIWLQPDSHEPLLTDVLFERVEKNQGVARVRESHDRRQILRAGESVSPHLPEIDGHGSVVHQSPGYHG